MFNFFIQTAQKPCRIFLQEVMNIKNKNSGKSYKKYREYFFWDKLFKNRNKF